MSQTPSRFPRLVATIVIPGGAADTTFNVPGNIAAGDVILMARHVSANLVTNADITGDTSIPAASHNQVRVETVNTTGNFVVVTYAKAAGT